ncbi:YciI family protein [Blastococcus capsensis]|uniref:YciI family protein n=1 Tax=Blastococcus capsensis TaxID=1564163 RepID=UPI00254034E5|nr:YciI family protein [Blastococcus capsensis]MDK3256827.1 hypothetical protein [Blastococcus capsensis]
MPAPHPAALRVWSGGMHLVLEYALAEDYLERRGALRADHLHLARAAHERGELLPAGALPDPYDRALLIWTAPREVVERFVAQDPYVVEGLVTAWTIRPSSAVVGRVSTRCPRRRRAAAGDRRARGRAAGSGR